MNEHATVKVDVHEERGRVYAFSDDLLGLILSHEDRQKLLLAVPEVIETLYRHKGFADVKVTLLSSSTNIATGPDRGFQRYNVECR